MSQISPETSIVDDGHWSLDPSSQRGLISGLVTHGPFFRDHCTGDIAYNYLLDSSWFLAPPFIRYLSIELHEGVSHVNKSVWTVHNERFLRSVIHILRNPLNLNQTFQNFSIHDTIFFAIAIICNL